MSKVYIVGILFFLATYAQGQTKNTNAGGIEMQVSAADPSLNAIFCSVGIEPEFPGGITKLFAFAKRKLIYPQTAVNDNIQGSVLLQFSINKKGIVTNKKIIEGVRYDLDNACMKMLNQMPRWKPGLINGKPIETYHRWKIIFILIE